MSTNTARANHPYNHPLWNMLFTTANAETDIGIELRIGTVIVLLHPGDTQVGTRSDACRKSIESTHVLL